MDGDAAMQGGARALATGLRGAAGIAALLEDLARELLATLGADRRLAVLVDALRERAPCPGDALLGIAAGIEALAQEVHGAMAAAAPAMVDGGIAVRVDAVA